MKIEKAIEIQTQYIKGTDLLYLPEFPEAIQLGIEALKRLQQLRLSPITWFRSPLPGETKD